MLACWCVGNCNNCRCYLYLTCFPNLGASPHVLTMQRRFAYVTVYLMEVQHTSIVQAREWQLARTPIPSITRGEVWYFICPVLTMPVVRVHIVAMGVYTPQCSCHLHWVCCRHGKWQLVLHMDSD